VLSRDGYARIASKYNAHGNGTELAFFGIDGKPVLIKEGFARIASKSDARGNLIEEAYYGIDGKPVLSRDGYARIASKYDARGNEIERAYFGIDGKPVLIKDGYARIIRTYNAHRQLIKIAYFDTAGHSALFKGTFAQLEYIYDERSQRVVTTAFNARGKRLARLSVYSRRMKKLQLQQRKILAARQYMNLPPVIAFYLAEADKARKLGVMSNNEAASAYLDAAYYRIFARQFDQSVAASRKALALRPKTLIIQANLASALMFLGKTQAARKIYLAHRGKMIGKTRWEDGILGDFKEFRKHGLSHPLMDEITAAFAAKKTPPAQRPKPAPAPSGSQPKPPAAPAPGAAQ